MQESVRGGAQGEAVELVIRLGVSKSDGLVVLRLLLLVAIERDENSSSVVIWTKHRIIRCDAATAFQAFGWSQRCL